MRVLRDVTDGAGGCAPNPGVDCAYSRVTLVLAVSLPRPVGCPLRVLQQRRGQPEISRYKRGLSPHRRCLCLRGEDTAHSPLRARQPSRRKLPPGSTAFVLTHHATTNRLILIDKSSPSRGTCAMPRMRREVRGVQNCISRPRMHARALHTLLHFFISPFVRP